jgi:hypothetical protein
MHDPAYAAFSALDPFFDIVRRGLAGLVDGDHYFDTIAPDAVFEFRYRFPGWPTKVVGREALMALYAGYGEGMALHGADALVVNISSLSMKFRATQSAPASFTKTASYRLSRLKIGRLWVGATTWTRWRRCPH